MAGVKMAKNKAGGLGKGKRMLLNAFFPWKNCLICGEANLETLKNIAYRKNQGYICPACKQKIQQYESCTYCSVFLSKAAVGENMPVCSWCREKRLPYITDCVSVAPYQGKLRQFLLDLKYNQKQGVARPMGEMVARQVETMDWQCDVLVSVPLHSKRQRERGYNQSELIALAAADRLRLPYYRQVIERIKETKIQNKLTWQQRAQNVADAFWPGKNGNLVKGKRVLLIDDIITSGSTVCNCAKALLSAGANMVYAAAVASPIDKKLV